MSYFEKNEPTRRVNILGTEYGVFMDVPSSADKCLETNAGYCDHTSRRIVICRKEPEDDIDDFDAYQKRVLRHELIHAFLFESGLGRETVWHPQDGRVHSEQMVDWLARQVPKMIKAFEETDAI